MRALDFLRGQFIENSNGIPLTKIKAFRRALVADAIRTIKWRDWTEQKIYHGYMPIKVAGEYHFEPFWILHHILLEMKLVRHYRDRLLLSKAGAALFACCFDSFNVIAQDILFRTPYFEESRVRGGIMGHMGYLAECA